MYQTNSTNSIHSAMQASSFMPLQQKLLVDEERTHDPDRLVINQVFEHYHQALKARPQLLEMLIRRKIDPDLADRYQIGFADRTLGYELQTPECLLGSRNRGQLQRLGLLKASGHEFFRGAIVIPYRDDFGKIAGGYGRRPGHQRRTPAYHLYWNVQLVSFFNVTSQPLPESLILCKSALDVLTLLTAGVDNAIATMGMQGFNDIQLSRLLEDGVRNVYIAFDNAPAANRYALLVAQALETIGIRSFRIHLPLGQDVNRFAMMQSDVAGALNHLVESAVPLKQRYGELVPQVKDRWLKQFVSIEDCVAFFLEEQRQAGKTFRTLNTARIHLERFRDYCCSRDIDQIADVNSEILEAYQHYLTDEKSVFTGKVISTTTQMERRDAVSRMLSRLYYYGITSGPVTFVTHAGPLH